MVEKHRRVHPQTNLSVVDYCLHGEFFRIWVELLSSYFFYGTDS